MTKRQVTTSVCFGVLMALLTLAVPAATNYRSGMIGTLALKYLNGFTKQPWLLGFSLAFFIQLRELRKLREEVTRLRLQQSTKPGP